MYNTKYEIPRKYADLTIEFIRLFNVKFKKDWENSRLMEIESLSCVGDVLTSNKPISYDHICFVVFALEIANDELEVLSEENHKTVSTLLAYYSDLKLNVKNNR